MLVPQANGDQSEIAVDPGWLRLLHFQDSKSIIDDPAFFLAPAGKSDSAAELRATIEAFRYNPLTQCEFPARSRFLRQQGFHFNSVPCPHLKSFLKKLDPKSLTLVYPASFFNNPASMFGHTFLRVDSANGLKLTSTAINYGAAALDPVGFIYAFKGLLGYYQGYFTTEPYHQHVKSYIKQENRDIWEFELNFSKADTIYILEHLWELQGHWADYYFLSENCSSMVLELLSIIDHDLVRGWPKPWVIPIDTIFDLKNRNHIKAAKYRPSDTNRFRHLIKGLSIDTALLAAKIATEQLNPEILSENTDLTTNEKMDGLSLAAGLIDRRYRRGEIEREQFASLYLETLTRRSRLPRKTNNQKPLPSPIEGQPSAMVAVGYGNQKEPYSSLELRLTAHDLLDAPHKQDAASSLTIGKLSLRATDERMSVYEATVMEFWSLPVWDPVLKPYSWRLGIHAKRESDIQDGKYQTYILDGATGMTFGHTHMIWYGLAQSNIRFRVHTNQRLSLAFGIENGLIGSLGRSRIQLSLLTQRFWNEIISHRHTLELALIRNFRFGAIVIKAANQKSHEQYLSSGHVEWRTYF